MKKKTVIVSAVAAVLLIAVSVGIVLKTGGNKAPQNEFEKGLIGRWAYAHDLETAVASFYESGKAEYDGVRYQFSCDGERIHFSDKAGEAMALRYTQNDDKMYLYIQSRYVLENGAVPDGIAGVWVCRETNWTYEFTDKGTFMEDGVLTGHYFVDEENGVIKLVYEEVLEDTVFYYRLTEEGLFIEYPWLMERMQ